MLMRECGFIRAIGVNIDWIGHFHTACAFR